MDVRITTRHFEIQRELRESIESRMRSGVGKYFPRAVEANVILSMEKHRYLAEVDIRVRRTSFRAQEETHDLQSVLDRVINKIETQMRRYKGKSKSHGSDPRREEFLRVKEDETDKER